MALGGGTFISQNKKLPGSYINFASAQNASSSIGERGIAAIRSAARIAVINFFMLVLLLFLDYSCMLECPFTLLNGKILVHIRKIPTSCSAQRDAEGFLEHFLEVLSVFLISHSLRKPGQGNRGCE